METTCRNGHPWTNTTTYTWHGNKPYRRCPVCERARARLAWDARHAGHDVINTSTRTIDGHYARRCLTCAGRRAYTPPEADTAAVQRAVLGDPPPRLNVTERREAVLKLRGELSGRLIAQRIGISPRTVWRHLAAVRTGVAV
jgi:DNA-binding CsgD family transcriptional regulator